MTLRDLAEFEVKNRLLAVPGVAAVERLGGYLRQFQVQLDPDRMSARGVTLDEVLHAVEERERERRRAASSRRAPMEWTVRAVGPRRRRSRTCAAPSSPCADDVPVLLGDVADVREAPAVRRGVAHRLSGEVVSCRVVKQFGADTVTVAARHPRGRRRHPARRCRRACSCAIVYDQSELVDSALGGVGRAVLLGARASSSSCCSCCSATVRAALLVTLTIPLSIALAGLLLQPAGRRHQHDDARRPRHRGRPARRRRDHRHREHRPPAASGVRATPRRDGRARARRIEVGRPIAFATLIVDRRVPAALRHDRHRRAHVPAAGGRRDRRARRVARPGADARAGRRRRSCCGRRAAGAHEDVWLIRARQDASTRRCSTAACGTPGWSRHRDARRHGPGAGAGARASARDFMPQLDEGAFLLQTILPPEASLDEVDRAEPPRRGRAARSSRGRGRGAAHRPRRAHRGSDAAHGVRRAGRAEAGSQPRARTSSKTTCARRSRTCPASRVLFTTPLGMRIDEGLGGTPADLSVRDLRPGSRRAGAAGRARRSAIMADVDGHRRPARRGS